MTLVRTFTIPKLATVSLDTRENLHPVLVAGKSTLALGLSKDLGIPWVTTDDILKWMQALVRKEDYPDLFYIDEGMTAQEYYKKYQTPQEVVEHEGRQQREAQKGVTAMIENFWWWDKFIIEDIAITPEYVREFQTSHPDIAVQAVFLVDRDKQRIKERLYTRGVWDKADKYPDYIKPLELGWVLLAHQYYEAEAPKYGFELHDITEIAGLKRRLASENA